MTVRPLTAQLIYGKPMSEIGDWRPVYLAQLHSHDRLFIDIETCLTPLDRAISITHMPRVSLAERWANRARSRARALSTKGVPVPGTGGHHSRQKSSHGRNLAGGFSHRTMGGEWGGKSRKREDAQRNIANAARHEALAEQAADAADQEAALTYERLGYDAYDSRFGPDAISDEIMSEFTGDTTNVPESLYADDFDWYDSSDDYAFYEYENTWDH